MVQLLSDLLDHLVRMGPLVCRALLVLLVHRVDQDS